MKRIYPDTPIETTLAQIDAVQKLLGEYQGEPVEAHEHAIHKAVVALERMLIQTPESKQTQRLPGEINMRWYAMLHVSRAPAKTPEQREMARCYAAYFYNLLEDLRECVKSGEWRRATQDIEDGERRWPPEFADPFPWPCGRYDDRDNL